jgi:hypothetical protein
LVRVHVLEQISFEIGPKMNEEILEDVAIDVFENFRAIDFIHHRPSLKKRAAFERFGFLEQMQMIFRTHMPSLKSKSKLQLQTAVKNVSVAKRNAPPAAERTR